MPAKIQAAIAATKHPMVVILTLLTLVSCGGGGGWQPTHRKQW